MLEEIVEETPMAACCQVHKEVLIEVRAKRDSDSDQREIVKCERSEIVIN